MIKITQRKKSILKSDDLFHLEDKWRIAIGEKDSSGEEWEFPDFESMKMVLDQLLIIKEKYGKL